MQTCTGQLPTGWARLTLSSSGQAQRRDLAAREIVFLFWPRYMELIDCELGVKSAHSPSKRIGTEFKRTNEQARAHDIEAVHKLQ